MKLSLATSIPIAALVGAVTVWGVATAMAPSKECESPTAIRILKELAENKLRRDVDYLLPYADVYKVSTAIRNSTYNRTLVLTPSAIRDRGSLASGRDCAALLSATFPMPPPHIAVTVNIPAIPDLFEFAASYTVERTNDSQIIVTASFSPK